MDRNVRFAMTINSEFCEFLISVSSDYPEHLSNRLRMIQKPDIQKFKGQFTEGCVCVRVCFDLKPKGLQCIAKAKEYFRYTDRG